MFKKLMRCFNSFFSKFKVLISSCICDIKLPGKSVWTGTVDLLDDLHVVVWLELDDLDDLVVWLEPDDLDD